MPSTSQVKPTIWSSRIANIGVSEILQIGAHAAQLKSQGLPVITLGAGEPDFDTPKNIKLAAKQAIDRGDTKYTSLDGTKELKQAIRSKFERDNGLEYELDEITVSSGAKQILFNAFMATLDEGDEVIIPAPFWTSYIDIVTICGGVPVIVECSMENGFLLTADNLSAAITAKTKWVLFNSPSNPSGAAYSINTYRPLLELLLTHPNILILSDDIYEHLVYDDVQFTTPAAIEPRLKERILTCNGVSKAYAMTGWRIGYAGGPKDLIRAMAIVQSQSTSCPSSISQAAACEALAGTQDFLEINLANFDERRRLVVDGLNKIEGIACPTPIGAFYVFANCSGVLGKKTPGGKTLETDKDFCTHLLETAYIAIVPGTVFGLSPFFRVSFAASEAELREAIARIAKAVKELC